MIDPQISLGRAVPGGSLRYNRLHLQDQMVEQTDALRRWPAADWRWVMGFALLIGGGCFLRFWHLGRESLWFDEGYSAWMITHAPGEIIGLIRHDVSPPLYYLLLHGWAAVFGESEFALRSLSAAAGCAALPIMALLARRLTGSWFGAAVATVVFGVSVLQVQYAQEARSYGLASMFALAAFYAMVRRTEGNWWWTVLAGGTAGAAVWLHNMMWFYVAGLSLAYLIAPGKTPLRRRVMDLVWTNGLIVAAFVPWVPALRGQMQWLSGNFWASVPSVGDLCQVLLAVGGVKMMHLSAVGPGWLAWIVGAVLVTIVVVASWRSRGTDARWAAALVVYALAPILAVFIYAHFRQSFFVEKVFTASTLAIPLLAALAATSRGRWIGMGAVLVLVAGSTLSLWGYYRWEEKEDWRGATAYVNSIPRESTLVVFVANEGQLLYDYYTQQTEQFGHAATGAPQGFLDLQPPRTIQRVLRAEDTRHLQSILDETQPARVVLVLSHTHFSDPEMLTRKMVQSRMKLVSEKAFHWVEVAEFAAP